MKKIILVIALLIFLPFNVYADRIVLDNVEVLSTPNSTHLDWYVDKIDAGSKTLIVKYRWLDSNGDPIYLAGRNLWHTWSVRDTADNPTTVAAECLGVGDPWECCTGVGTGDCDETITDFSDIFSFQVRQVDVGTPIGAGLRTLIWNKMKSEILTPGNSGSFE